MDPSQPESEMIESEKMNRSSQPESEMIESEKMNRSSQPESEMIEPGKNSEINWEAIQKHLANVKFPEPTPYTDDDFNEIDDDVNWHPWSDKEWDAYNSQVEESDGFDVEPFPGVFSYSVIRPMRGDFDHVKPYAKFAIQRENERKHSKLELTEIIKWNAQMAGPMNYYITFKARDNATDQEDVYQALVLSGIKMEESEVSIFRRKAISKRKQPPTDNDDARPKFAH